MARTYLTIIFAISICVGCTTPALRRHTVNQAISVTALRYQEVLQGLAVVANNRGVLPSVAVNTGGTTSVANTIGFDSATTWDTAVQGFSRQLLNLSGRHVPQQQWTLAPVAAEPNLEAIYAAYCWVIFGPPEDGSIAMERLRAPAHGDKTGLHFNVENDMRALPTGWLGCGRHCDVPNNACYTANCCETYVWVTPQGMAGLSDFTLIVMDIATTDPQSIVLQQPLASVDLVRLTDRLPPKEKDEGPKMLSTAPLTMTETRSVEQVDPQHIYIQKERILKQIPTLEPREGISSPRPPISPRALGPQLLQSPLNAPNLQ
jgi:hypothetical protein